MRKFSIIALVATLALGSCASKKEFDALEVRRQQTQDLLNSATLELNTCLEEKKATAVRIEDLKAQVENMQVMNSALVTNQGDLTNLSQQGAVTLQKSLEQIQEKDLRINKMRDAITRKDSMTIALVTSLKGALNNIADEDIEISVEKGVVFISISDKLLFKSGRYNVTSRAKEILGKVAIVVNDKPDLEFMVEGHTDNRPMTNSSASMIDNWDLSVKRATAVVRVLQNEYNVAPERMVAAGRSFYVPVDYNDTSDGRAKNRRTRIVILPNIDQFYKLVEDGMK